MLGMLKRHEVEILLKAGHPKTEVARLAGVSLCSVKRIAEETPVVHVDDAAEREKRQIGRPSLVNHILLTGQSFVIFLLYGSSAAGKRQRGDACQGAVMYCGFSHCLADGDTFPEDDVLLPVPEG